LKINTEEQKTVNNKNLIKPNENKIMKGLLSYNKSKLKKKKFFFYSTKTKIDWKYLCENLKYKNQKY